jgi:hypothetical protein
MSTAAPRRADPRLCPRRRHACTAALWAYSILGACSCLQCSRATHRAAVLDDQCDTYAAERQTCSVEYALCRVQHASGCSPCGISRASIPVCADVARCVCEYSHLSARPRFTFAHRLRTVTQARTVTPLEALGPALVALRANSASHLYRQDSLPCTATAENTGTANNSSVGPVPPSRRRYRQVIRQLSDDNVALRMSQQSATLQAHSAAPLGRLSVLYPLAPSHGPRLAGLAPRPLLCRPLRFRVSECTLRFASGIALG